MNSSKTNILKNKHMLDYSLITNEQLRQLVIRSESVNSLSEDQIQAMVNKMALLPESGTTAMIAVFEKEQQKIQNAKTAKGIPPEIEQKRLDEKISAVAGIKREFETGVKVETERVDQEATLMAAEELLKDLDKV